MKAILFFLFSFVCVSASAQTWEWARKADATSAEEGSKKIRTDSYGNIYMMSVGTGNTTYGSTTLPPGLFLVKFAPSGLVLWATSLPFPFTGFMDFNVDEAGNSYFLSVYNTSLSAYSFNFTSNGEADVYIFKFDPSGNALWGRSFGGTGQDISGTIAIDRDQNIYFDGSFKTSISFDTDTLSASPAGMFLVKLNSSGNTIWATKGDNSFEFGKLITLDKDQNPYVIGFTPLPPEDIFIAKFDVHGNLLSHSIVFGIYDFVPSMAISESGNIYLIHNGGGHYHFVPILVKYDSMMNEQWSKTIGTGYGCYNFREGLFLDESENIFVAGDFGGQYCSYDSVYFEGELAYVGENSVPAIAMYSASGNMMWFSTAASADLDWTVSLARDASGGLIIAGGFNTMGVTDTLSFGAHALVNDGSWRQSFLAKFNPSALSTAFSELSFNDVYIFPNPSSGIFTLQMNGSSAKICVRDVMGRCVFQKDCKSETLEIDLSAQSKGIYFLEVLAEGKREVKKIVLQ